jgi:hypothetical protein
LLACAFHIEYHSALLTFCAAFFPAFGAAIYGIRNQGEFQRIAERSGAMSVELDRTEKAVMDPDTVLSSSTLGQAADEAVEIMAAEVLDWRIVFQARPLVLPA